MIGAALSFLTGGSAARLVATLLVGVAAGSWGAWQVQNWRQNTIELQRIHRAAKDTARNVEIQDRAVGTYVQEQANAKPIYQRITVEVDKIVERPVYRDQCFDADGLRQLGAAIAGRDAEPGSGQPVPAAR
ncbi:hypothetical protein [Hydrogenophaga sp.]|uniref:hypothetical protein n=1 Tax=Hydrogenophaga sp. TaxID=1904254 RepID=UPI002730F523|nr:hypothetical protein [Hydrogenophaga sp.]MDP1686899.1 hypothetical protein [Hydrogenophaga sp.]